MFQYVLQYRPAILTLLKPELDMILKYLTGNVPEIYYLNFLL